MILSTNCLHLIAIFCWAAQFCFVSFPLKEESSETVTLQSYLTGCCSDQLLNFLVFCQKLHTKKVELCSADSGDTGMHCYMPIN